MKTKKFTLTFFSLLLYVATFSQTYIGSEIIISDSASYAYSVYAIDLDKDGDVDVLSASYGDKRIIWYENDGNQNFTGHVIATSVNGAISVFSIDLDGDGDNDVLSAAYYDDEIAWYENDGSGNFSTKKVITTSTDGVMNVFSIDLDGDGDNDVLSASRSDDKIAWYENDGSGSFSEQKIIIDTAAGAIYVYSRDLDGDGDNDVLSASIDDDKIAWYENDGSGNFSGQKVIIDTADGAMCVFSIDLDGDGDNDVLSASSNDNKIAWYENDGNGNFSGQKVIINTADGASSVFSIDLDGDGDNDVLSASWNDDKIAWYENDGNGNFSTQKVITTSANTAICVYSTDLDGDGDNDVFSAADFDDKIAWYENFTIEIRQQPQDKTVCEGASTTFQIEAKDCSGYQWQLSTDGGITFTDLSDDTTYSGATTNTLTLNADSTMNGYKYRCVVSNNAGSQNSDIASIIIDTQAPQVAVTTLDKYLDASGNVQIYASEFTLTDISEITDSTLSQSAFDCGNTGTNSITLSTQDVCGNSASYDLTVNVADTILPTLTATDTTIYLDTTGSASITVEDVIVSASDNCSLQDTGLSQTSFDCSNVGENAVSVLISDASGNSDTAHITITVLDTLRPVISCVADQEVNADASDVYVVNGTEFDPANTSDNCGVASISNDFNGSASLDGAELPVGTHTITWTVTDDAGNQAECTFTVIVNNGDAINEVANSVKVYPNPTTGVFTIDLSNTNAESLQIIDVTGKVVLQQDINTTATTVDLTGFANGIYTVKIQTSEGVEVMKIVKQ